MFLSSCQRERETVASLSGATASHPWLPATIKSHFSHYLKCTNPFSIPDTPGCEESGGRLCLQTRRPLCASPPLSEPSAHPPTCLKNPPTFLFKKRKKESGTVHWFWTTRSNSFFRRGLIRVLLHTSAHRGCFCTCTNPQLFPGKSAAANVMTHPITFHKFCPLLS